jgi:dienelactone hydrolase
VISHGRNSDKRADYQRPRFESAARYFVRKGFAVAVPLRLGYGELADAGDPESSVSCDAPRFGSALRAAAQQILTVRDFMAAQTDIDASRTVLVGVSVGGIATIAATSAHAPGLVAAINFAGGHGGNPEKRPGDPCQSEQLRRLYRSYAEGNARTQPATPTLWVYAENDQYFGPNHARRWARAYAEGGGAVDLRVLPAFGEDGHKLFSAGNDVWQPLVDEFLQPLGFGRPGSLAAPAPVQPLAGEASAPVGARSGQLAGFQKFLAAKLPRAFATDGAGHWGYAQGDDVLSRALAFCQRNIATTADGTPASTCHLHAVDDSVVWPTP